MKLETIEDFQKIAKALQDPNSKPKDYRVKTFGFCLRCIAVTEYTTDGSSEGFNIHCEHCHSNFGTLYMHDNYDTRLYWRQDNEIPAIQKPMIDAMHTRERQQAFFTELLATFIIVNAKNRKEAGRQVRKTAKAVHRGNAIRASFGLRPIKHK